MKALTGKQRFEKFDLNSSGDITLYEQLLNKESVVIKKEQTLQDQRRGTLFLLVWYIEKI